MKRNLLEYLEATVQHCPDKPAFSNGERWLTYQALYTQARAAGSFLCCRHQGSPILVFMERQPEMIAAFLAVLYSGNFYIPVEEEMSHNRIALIIQEAKPAAIICDAKTAKAVAEHSFTGPVYQYADIAAAPEDSAALAAVRANALDVDSIYIVFTSGSTGTPKGVLACHRNVIDYIEALSEVLDVQPDTVFGMQVPLYVDACLKEIWPAIKHGATTVLIPKSLFLFPVRLVEFMNTHGVNTVCWVVSALTMISGFGALAHSVPTLRTVAFGSEVFPIKQFNLWRQALPNARFINLYGPTECTGMSCWYEVDRDFALDEAIPIGRPFANTGILLMDEDKLVTEPGQPGEIYIRGAGVTLGYYNNPARTAEAFVQNPLHTAYPELVYRTGDLAKYNPQGELVYISRKDYQIKHMGYRIELMEIEAAAARMDSVQDACCVFDKAQDKIVLYYTCAGAAACKPDDGKEIAAHLRKVLPRYMAPAACIRLDKLPHTQNGKADRALMTQWAQELQE